MREDIELVGVVDIYVLDEDNRIVQHKTAYNQITEPYARWLLFGNLGTHYTTTIFDKDHSGNGISHLLFSSPYQKETPPSVIDPNLDEGYQIVTGLCGQDDYSSVGEQKERVPRFAIYALDCDIDIKPNTVFPPVYNPDLQTLNLAHLACYSNPNQKEETEYTFAPSTRNRGWSGVRTNPLFTTAYIRSYGRVVVKSVFLGASHKTVSESFPCVVIRQSPSEIPIGWEAEQDGADGVYLIAPFIRTSTITSRSVDYLSLGGMYDGDRFGDGLYGTGYTGDGRGDNVTFWDYGTNAFFTGSGSNIYNPVTNEDFSTSKAGFIHDEIAGGFALGYGKAIRANKGNTEFSDGKCIGRSVIFTTQEKLINKVDVKELETPMLYATEGTSIPETIYTHNSPVMVAKRGESTADDRIEVFVSLGVGTFTEYTDERGFYHPGGTGVEIHKLVLYIDHYRYTTTGLEMVLDDNPELLVNYGRVAVLPYAIGFMLDESKDSGLTYLAGSYDVPWDMYYLPITHILSGVDTLDWSFDGEGLDPMLCATERQQPGVVYYGCAWDFIRVCLLGFDDTRLVYLSVYDGFLPIPVNRLQRWSTLAGMVLSGVSIDEPIVKEENQRLVINYSYGFRVMDNVLKVVSFEVTEDLTESIHRVRLEVSEGGVYVTVKRTDKGIYGAQWDYPGVLTFDDRTVEPAKKCFYRASCWNGGQNSEYLEVVRWSPYKGATHWYFICFDSGTAEDIPRQDDQILCDLRTGDLYLTEREGEYVAKWYSTYRMQDGELIDLPNYEVTEVPEEYFDIIVGRCRDGEFIVCPERRSMYIVYQGEAVKINCESLISL